MQTNLWQKFFNKFNLSKIQIDKFIKYSQLLQSWNEKINLTNITETSEIILYHFEDSLSVTSYIDFNSINSISDIGTGAGFPAIPIKIKYSHLKVILIEVNAKKRKFLENLKQELSLENVEICELDWRTFLRKSKYSIDIFLSRASLHPEELTRLFQKNCTYNNSRLIYWASLNWEPKKKELAYLEKEEIYDVGNKTRKLIFFINKL